MGNVHQALLVLTQCQRCLMALMVAVHDVQIILQLAQVVHTVVEQICQFTVSGDAHGLLLNG